MEKAPCGTPDFDEDNDYGCCIDKTPIIHQVLRKSCGVLVAELGRLNTASSSEMVNRNALDDVVGSAGACISA